MSVLELLRLVPPPDKPIGAGIPAGWKEVEDRLELALPPDYKEIVDRYGIGWFGNWLMIYSPFAETFNLFEQNDRILPLFDGCVDSDPDSFPPYPVYPEEGGLLLFGQDENSGPLCFVTNGPPARWPIVIMDNKYLRVYSRKIDATLSELLFGWFTGKLGEADHSTLHPPRRNEFVPGSSPDYSWYE